MLGESEDESESERWEERARERSEEETRRVESHAFLDDDNDDDIKKKSTEIHQKQTPEYGGTSGGNHFQSASLSRLDFYLLLAYN